jgi:hypothetical protein
MKMKTLASTEFSTSTKRAGSKAGKAVAVMALALAGSLLAIPQAAYADTAVIWGRQTAMGKFETKKVDLNAASTIASERYEGGGDGYCIWSGAPRSTVVTCWRKGDPSLVGKTLPAGRGYYIVPAKRTTNSPAYAQVTVK